MNIDIVHSHLDFIIDKEKGGEFSPEEKDAALDKGQLAWFDELYGNTRQYIPGRYVPAISYGVSQAVDDALQPFKVAPTSFTSNSDGLISLPSNYLHLISLYTNEDNQAAGRFVKRPVEIIREDELAYRLESQLCPVNVTSPIGILYTGKKLQLYPQSAQVGTLHYFRRPVAPLFGYSLVGRVVTYNSGTSTHLEWDDVNVMHVINKALQILGINLEADRVVAYANAKDKEGS